MAPARPPRGLSALLRQAVGMEAVAHRLAEMIEAGHSASAAILGAIEELRQRAAEERLQFPDALEVQLGQALSQTERRVHQTLAHLDERATQLYAGLHADVQRGADETRVVAAHLDQRLETLLAKSAQLETSLFESRFLQNHYFGRDNLPSALAVKQYYLQLKSAPGLCDFDEAGMSVFSQNTEDGVLLHIFSVIGMKAKRCIEIGCDLSGSTVGIPEGNTINLICNFGFDGLIVDLDAEKTAAIRHFFASALATKHYHRPAMEGRKADYFSPSVVTREISVGNINAVLAETGFTGEVDLLSIDVDGPDLSLWKAVQDLSPRVVIVEVNNRLPFDSVVFGDYATSTEPPNTLGYQQSRSSSLGAACQLGDEKGYVFVGMDTTLLNAFFVRRDAWDARLPARAPADYVSHTLSPLLNRQR